MKTCRVCKEEKEENLFSINKKRKSGLNDECKECQKKYFKEYYKNNKQTQIDRVQKNSLISKIEIWKIKLENGCKICGYKKNPSALHFHHRDSKDKSFEIAQNTSYTKELVLKEIKKCDILCANCHSEYHSKYSTEEILELIKNYKEKKIVKKRKINREPKINKDLCECGSLKQKINKKCFKCSQISRPSKVPPKEELEKLIWIIPTTKIAKIYEVTDKAVEKWCKKYNIEKPPRGYWQKL